MSTHFKFVSMILGKFFCLLKKINKGHWFPGINRKYQVVANTVAVAVIVMYNYSNYCQCAFNCYQFWQCEDLHLSRTWERVCFNLAPNPWFSSNAVCSPNVRTLRKSGARLKVSVLMVCIRETLCDTYTTWQGSLFVSVY